jgi:hypothetical protein
MTEEKTQYKSLKKKKVCKVCKKEVSTRNWARHLVSKTHTAKADGTYKEPAYKQKKEKKQRKKKPVEEKKEEGVLQETKGEDPCLEICRKARLPPVYHTVKTGQLKPGFNLLLKLVESLWHEGNVFLRLGYL